MTNDSIIDRAQAIAARDGGEWADHLIAARREAALPPLQKLVKKSNAANEAMRKRAALAQQMRHMPGEGNPDPDRRIEIGEVETQLGRVRVTVSRDDLSIHGVNAALAELDVDLRTAIVSTSAAFAAAILDVEQTEQRALVGFVVQAILRRHQFLNARVKEVRQRERYDV
jgi:hypothetical protein